MPLEQDYYDVLGVQRDADDAEIKRAFRQLARRLHPDVAPAPDERFQEVVAAYEVLSRPERRRLYDRFGRRNSRRSEPRVAPAVPPLQVELEWYEAERGVSKLVELDDAEPCAECHGHGMPHGYVRAHCVRCRGTGRLSNVRESKAARVIEFESCPDCAGGGRAPAPECEACEGSGAITTRRTIRMRIPAGVRDGDLIQVEGIDRRFRLAVPPRPRDSRLLLLVSGCALLCALGLLLYLLLR
jgi:molecular chaperone DnaJ